MMALVSALIGLAMCIVPGECRRISTKMKPSKMEKRAVGSFAVTGECEDCNNGYTLSQISYHGYDKPAPSDVETFFISNSTDRTLVSVGLYIIYMDLSGKQINKRFVKADCDIPSGETRLISIRSWDKQHSFYYFESQKPRRTAHPYKVRLDPVSAYLSFEVDEQSDDVTDDKEGL